MNTQRFLWGAATSSHQVEGNNTRNDWWEWERQGRVREASGTACDQYNRFKADFEIVRQLRHTAHRFSLEWSRLEPSEGVWDEAAWEHYREVVRTLRGMNIEPLPTLNHFTLPLWLARRGGWSHPSSVDRFERFAAKAVESLGEGVTYWMTINEPLVLVYLGYVRGIWPPGEKNVGRIYDVLQFQMQAHSAAYVAMHAVAGGKGRAIKVGLAHNMARFFPASPLSPFDRWAASRRHHFFNHLFIRSLMDGRIAEKGFRDRPLRSARSLDFLGLNYYTYERVRFKGWYRAGSFGEAVHRRHDGISEWTNALGWKVYPKGIYEILKDLERYKIPLIVTENGICTADDAERGRFISEHLDEVFRAKREGVPLFGYLYWSLLDNFEWADGYGPRFGIVGVNYADQSRTVRPSAHLLTQKIQELLAVSGLE